MVTFRRPSGQATAVVLALAEEPATWRYGYELCQQLDLTAGTLYPALMQLADRGLLETAWERDVPAGRPPRHLYRLTGPGRVLAGRLAAGSPVPPKVARVARGAGSAGLGRAWWSPFLRWRGWPPAWWPPATTWPSTPPIRGPARPR